MYHTERVKDVAAGTVAELVAALEARIGERLLEPAGTWSRSMDYAECGGWGLTYVREEP